MNFQVEGFCPDDDGGCRELGEFRRCVVWLTADALPESLGSDFSRESLARIFNSSLELARAGSVKDTGGVGERELLEFFREDGFARVAPDLRKSVVSRLLQSPAVEPIRRQFLEQIATIVFRRASPNERADLAGAEEAVHAVLTYHPSGDALVHRIFAAASLNPDNRVGIARLVGAVNPQLQRELFSSVFDASVLDDRAFQGGLGQSDSLALCSLRFHDAVRLLQRVERLFDRDCRGYEAALDPFRVAMRSALQALVVKDHGLIMVPTLARTLSSPLSYEEEHSIVVPVLELLGSNKFVSPAVTALLSVPPIQAWLGSGRCHSELLPAPFYTHFPINQRAIEKAVESTVERGAVSDFARALLKVMRYVNRVNRDIAPSLLAENELEHVGEHAISAGLGCHSLYCEMVNILSLQPKGCAVAMKSAFRMIVDESTPPIVVPLLREEIRGALQRYPHIVLSAAASSPDPARAMNSVVESLVSSGKGKDRRAKEILIRWFLLLDEGQGDTLFRGAPLSVDKQRQAVACLAQSLTAALNRSADGHPSATQSSTPPEG